MGYTTVFDGVIEIDPPLNEEEISFLQKFSATRRMKTTHGPYWVDQPGYAGQDNDASVLNYNQPPDGQPSLWCQWIPSNNGRYLEWDQKEKFYESTEWMEYLIGHFIGGNPTAAAELPFIKPHTCNGSIRAYGEDSDDRWVLFVKDNEVYTASATINWPDT